MRVVESAGAMRGHVGASAELGSPLSGSVSGTAGADNLTGTEGNDTLLGKGGDDGLYGLRGADLLDGGTGNDWLDGGSGVNTLIGGRGDDTMYSGLANGELWGGDGADLVYAAMGSTTVLKIDGGAGIDQLVASVAPMTRAVKIDISKAAAGEAVAIGNRITLNNVEFVSITGTSFDDRMTGGRLNDTLIGGSGDDTLHGGAGNDRIDGSYEGASGVDHLYGDGGDDTVLIWGAGVADGGDGNDLVSGWSTAVKLQGGAGDDRLKGSSGKDTLDGGTGDDTLEGNGGSDTVDYAAVESAVNVSLQTGVADGQAIGHDVLTYVEIVFGSRFGDTLEGGDASETLEGGVGGDRLFGGDWNDVLRGGDGADTIDGGGYADTLEGGAGNDIFRFTTLWGPDRIVDLQAGDRIDFSPIDWDSTTSGDQAFRRVVKFSQESGVYGEMVVSYSSATGLTSIAVSVQSYEDPVVLAQIVGDHRSFDNIVL